MNLSRSARQVGIGISALALCALWLPTTALAQTKTPFTTIETTSVVNPGTWVTDGTSIFITGWRINGVDPKRPPPH